MTDHLLYKVQMLTDPSRNCSHLDSTENKPMEVEETHTLHEDIHLLSIADTQAIDRGAHS